MHIFIVNIPADSSQMIMVASPSKPFTYTAKNTARRQAIINEYDAEIAALYDAVEGSAQADWPPPLAWDWPNTVQFMRSVVKRVLKSPVSDTEDIFQKGCDRSVGSSRVTIRTLTGP